MDRREFLRRIGGGVAAMSLTGCARDRDRRMGPATSRRPNIVVILADDMGFSDIGCYGSEIETPHLDRLAAEGVRFTQAYCAARCCPTRAALLTGLYPHQAGMGRMVVRKGGEDREPGPYQGYLNDRCVTLAEVLKSAGYRTYMAGKWHVGEKPEHWPRRRGFDRYFGLISGASSYFEMLPQERDSRSMALDDDPILPEGDDFYMTDAFTDYAVDFLKGHAGRDEPFLLYLAYTAPHWPLHALPGEIEKYRGQYMMGWDELRRRRHARQLELGIVRPEWPLSPRDPDVPAWDTVEDKDRWDARMAVYAAMIDRMDQGIGRVLRQLDRMGAAEHTLVLFLSDNGACHESVLSKGYHDPEAAPGSRRTFDAVERPWANASNTPFRMFKHWVHEGGIATPLIARWPAHIRSGGGLTDQVAHVIDIMPTAVEAAQARYPAEFEDRPVASCEGISLLPVLAGGPSRERPALYWEHMKNRAIREGKWKLVAKKDDTWELYDLEADRTELKDLSGENVEKARDLIARYDSWAARVGV